MDATNSAAAIETCPQRFRALSGFDGVGAEIHCPTPVVTATCRASSFGNKTASDSANRFAGAGVVECDVKIADSKITAAPIMTTASGTEGEAESGGAEHPIAGRGEKRICFIVRFPS